jgi:hypothetical protein
VLEPAQVGDDARERGGDDRLVERRQQRGEHDPAEGDQHRAARQAVGAGRHRPDPRMARPCPRSGPSATSGCCRRSS